MRTLCLVLVGVAFLISLPLAAVMVKLGHRLGHVDHPDDPAGGGRKWHGRAVPNTGGVAIFWAVAWPMLTIMLAVCLVPEQSWTGWLEPVREHVAGLRQHAVMAFAVLGAAAAVHITGLVDDRRRLGPYSKLIVQGIVALMLAGLFEVRVLEALGRWFGVPGTIVSVLLSAAWIVAVTNAMNFMDNMDGLSAGVGAIIAALYLAATLLGGQWFVAAAAALLLGALLGFLVLNFPPAKLFMGDGGSLVLGLLLAVISVRTTYLPQTVTCYGSDEAASLRGHWYALLMPLVVLAVPLYDFTSVTLIRLSRGLSPFVGDRNHFSHRLVRMGLSERAAVLVIWLATLSTGLGGVMLARLEGWQAALVTAQAAAMLAVVAVLERSRAARE